MTSDRRGFFGILTEILTFLAAFAQLLPARSRPKTIETEAGILSRILKPFSAISKIDRISDRGFRRSGFVMRPTSPPIIIPPESGCQMIVAMKGPSPSEAACDTDATI